MAGKAVIDLFAGTGAIGLEALSRGAESAVFVEKDRETVGLIHGNVAKLRYQDRAQIRLADAHRWVRSHAADLEGPTAVFLDPPYREYEVGVKRIRATLDLLVEGLPAGSLIVLEAGRVLDDQILPDFDAWDVRRYGDTQVAFWLRDELEAEAEAEQTEAEAEPGEEHGDA
jgi:16S rRNA (guanine966-N2)-methyltransferase